MVKGYNSNDYTFMSSKIALSLAIFTQYTDDVV